MAISGRYFLSSGSLLFRQIPLPSIPPAFPLAGGFFRIRKPEKLALRHFFSYPGQNTVKSIHSSRTVRESSRRFHRVRPDRLRQKTDMANNRIPGFLPSGSDTRHVIPHPAGIRPSEKQRENSFFCETIADIRKKPSISGRLSVFFGTVSFRQNR